MDGISKESQKWGNDLLHPNKSKHGRVPRAAGVAPEDEGTVPRAEPSFGISDRGKSNDRSKNPHHPGKKPKGAGGGNDREG